MPSASGVYSLPAGYLAVTGQTIQASQHNPPLEDIAAALTLRLSRDGSAPMTGGLKGIAGSATLPSYAFATDASTGVFKTTNGLGITVSGTQVAEFTAAGMASGVRMLGEITAWARATCPALWVFPAGQTLSRTTYAALWAQAQIEIAAGNLFFNNGDGSTTFGIGDARGRVIAAPDGMGGTDAGRLSGGSMSGRLAIGGSGGEATHALTNTEMAVHNHGVNDPGHVHPLDPNIFYAGTPIQGVQGSGGGAMTHTSSPTGTSVTGITIQNSGSGGAHNNLQPTLLCNIIMFAGGA